MEQVLTPNEIKEMKKDLELQKFQALIIKQASELRKFDLPNHLKEFDLKKAIRLYYEVWDFAHLSGLGTYTNVINESIMNFVQVKEDADQFVFCSPNHIADRTLQLTQISTFISKICEISK